MKKEIISGNASGKTRGTWFGVDPRTKVIETKMKNKKKYACRGGKNYAY